VRAFSMTGFGATPAMTDVPIPEPEAGEVRVRVRAASVNGFDLAVPGGYLNDYFPYQFPLVIGKDFAGDVDAVAPDVTGYAPGDRVFGVVTKPFLREGRTPSTSPPRPPLVSPGFPHPSPTPTEPLSALPGPQRGTCSPTRSSSPARPCWWSV
jgi:hypothetical protein